MALQHAPVKEKNNVVASMDSEIDLPGIAPLLEDIFQRYGYDFFDYPCSCLIRRITDFMKKRRIPSISELQRKILRDHSHFDDFITGIMIGAHSMFRDPRFYLNFRTEVIPYLRTWPFIRIWCAGCGLGEEIYSLAIIIEEEGLSERCRIYATDVNELFLASSKKAAYPLSRMKEYARNYSAAGGSSPPFSRYYTASDKDALFHHTLQKNIVFARHNLVTDWSFNEFQAIVCHDVLSYFNNSLQERLHNLLYESLALGGILCLSDRETIKGTIHERNYAPIQKRKKLFRRIS